MMSANVYESVLDEVAKKPKRGGTVAVCLRFSRQEYEALGRVAASWEMSLSETVRTMAREIDGRMQRQGKR